MTQQALAARIAISRTSVSHIEAGLAQASERSVTLLAGVFHVEPYELVDGTDYPSAKAERLPLVANRYTEIDLALALFNRDLEWLARHPSDAEHAYADWCARLSTLRSRCLDPRDSDRIRTALEELRELRKGREP